jgi:sugar (pentulose or hexulose) kinase
MAKFPTDMHSHILRSRSEKTRHEREWSAAMRMLSGDQWLYWSSRAKDYNVIKRLPGEVRVTVNQMLNIERSIIARLTLNAPTPVVLPASDSRISRTGSGLLRSDGCARRATPSYTRTSSLEWS